MSNDRNRDYVTLDLDKLKFIEVQSNYSHHHIFYFEYEVNNIIYLYQIKTSHLYRFNKKHIITDLKIWAEASKHFEHHKNSNKMFYFSESYSISEIGFNFLISDENDEKMFIKFEKDLIKKFTKKDNSWCWYDKDIDENYVFSYFRKKKIKKLLNI